MTDSQRITVPAWVMAIAAMFSVQLGSALSIPLINAVGAAGAAFLRLSFAALIFLVIARPNFRSVTKKDLPGLIGLGVTTGLMTVTFSNAINLIPLGTAVSIEFLGPLTVATIRSHNKKAMIWPALALLGVLLMTKPWENSINVLGVAYSVASAIGWAVYILLTSWIGDRFEGLAGLSLTMPISAVAAAIFGASSALSGIDGKLLAMAAGLALVFPIIPFTLELKALRRMSEAAFGTLMALEPAFGVLLGLVILNQATNVLQLVGVSCVVIAGVATQRIDKNLRATIEAELL